MIKELKLHLILLDGPRVLQLQDKGAPLELRGAKLHAVKVLFDLDAKPKPLARAYDNASRSRTPYPAPPSFVTPEVRKRYEAEGEDVIEPDPERRHNVPKGVITRNGSSHNRYDELAGLKVLRVVADMEQPVFFRDVRDKIWAATPAGTRKMPQGTVGSQLHMLAKEGFLLKQHNATKHLMIYTITPEGEDLLTRPDPQEDLPL